MSNEQSEMKIGDIIVGVIMLYMIPTILLLLFSLTILAGIIAALVKLITIWS